jgi:predicted RecB family nuclease
MRLQEDQLLLSASDLSAHLGCQHRTQLDRRSAMGQLQAPPPDPMLAVLQVRGLAHEKAYVEHLESARAIQRVDLANTPLDAEGMAETQRAMAAGADVIAQAPLVAGRFRGIADVLLRVGEPSPELGAWSYVVVDTKLASETRAGTVLQLCLYSRIVGEIQGRLPDEFWVVSPGCLGDPEKFPIRDYLAFARRIERQLTEAVDGALPDEPSAPEPVNECDICRWWSRCDKRRRESDHLSFVAGISRLQRRELERLGVDTLTGLAGVALPLEPAPQRGSAGSYERVHHQARVQRDSIGKKPIVEFLPDPEVPGDGRSRLGLARLPEPSPRDVFLDLEGDPFIEGGGREYLFGWVTIGEGGKPEYTARWALDTAAEKAAFEELIDTLLARWVEHPDFVVYHFGAYETAALTRLMGRHATRAEELDRLLRGERFVDLHSVVRESLRIGVETYGLKQLEAVHGYQRVLDLREASLHKHRFERALELAVPEDAPEGSAQGVELYNRDDCVSTWRLRNWLEEKRAERIAAGSDLPRPALGEGIPSEDQEERSAEIQALMDALLDGIPEERGERSSDQQARWTLAHLLEWHRREGKAGWWEFFRLADLQPEDLRDEKNGLVGLEFVSRHQEGRKLPVDRYRFAPQDHDVRPGRVLYASKDQEIGTIEAIDLAGRMIDVKKRKVSVGLHPEAVFAHESVPAKPIPAALERLAREVAANGVDAPGRFRAARDLLLGQPPRLGSGFEGELARAGETTRESATRLALDLAESVLPVQGPPGTGKTHTGARVVCKLVRAGQKVGITGPSHKVIRNLLDEAVRAAAEEGLDLRILQRVRQGTVTEGGPVRESDKSDCLAAALAAGEVDVAAGTVWAWAREDTEGLVDTLVIDEAGQLSLANAIAASTAARNVLLLGDPQQLEQPIQGSHPEGCDTSALEHLLGTHDTVPPDRGLFLDTTWRLHPTIRAFTSELFYEGRLDHHPQCEGQALLGSTPFAGAGLWLQLVEHEGNTSSSPEEVERIAELVKTLVRPEVGWIDFDGIRRQPLTHEDLRIVSPYNAQVAALRAAIPEAAEQIGTVDRFQGQEAPVVIYSMTTSSTEEAPRGLEFLFSLNRLNVATSRARCTCILVASPALFTAECATPRQMKLVNALCRFREMASVARAGTHG